MFSFMIRALTGHPEGHRWPGERAQCSEELAVLVEESDLVSAPIMVGSTIWTFHFSGLLPALLGSTGARHAHSIQTHMHIELIHIE